MQILLADLSSMLAYKRQVRLKWFDGTDSMDRLLRCGISKMLNLYSNSVQPKQEGKKSRPKDLKHVEPHRPKRE